MTFAELIGDYIGIKVGGESSKKMGNRIADLLTQRCKELGIENVDFYYNGYCRNQIDISTYCENPEYWVKEKIPFGHITFKCKKTRFDKPVYGTHFGYELVSLELYLDSHDAKDIAGIRDEVIHKHKVALEEKANDEIATLEKYCGLIDELDEVLSKYIELPCYARRIIKNRLADQGIFVLNLFNL